MPCYKSYENYHETVGYRGKASNLVATRPRKKQIAPIEDYHIRGFNYMDYMNKPTPYTIDMKILSHRASGLPSTR